MSIYMFSVALLVLVVISAAQDDAYDEAHECEMERKCKDCWTMELCAKGNSWLQRWWIKCPFWAPYCNPYAQVCEATITPLCQSLQPAG